jgi:hypothetical protein
MDKLRRSGAALRELLAGIIHCQSKYLNNRAKTSHRPTREREQAIKRFLAAFSGISPIFQPRRDRVGRRSVGGGRLGGACKAASRSSWPPNIFLLAVFHLLM